MTSNGRNNIFSGRSWQQRLALLPWTATAVATSPNDVASHGGVLPR
jgi:hypothetical protein